jgi:hypothetical protein
MYELQAMALVGRLLSGPWMRKFYTNDSSISYVDSISIVRSVIDAIECFIVPCNEIVFTNDFLVPRLI